MKPFFTFYGGKWRVAPKYPYPNHDVIIEPFAGSAGYSLRHPEKMVRLFDADPIIVGVWNYLIHASESDILALPLMVDHVDQLQVCQEARWLIGFWLNKGTISPCKIPSKWMRDGLRPNSFWGETIRNRIASQVNSIRHWTVTQASYDSILRIPATWFVDPPYQSAGSLYRYHDIDYSQLADWCRNLPGQALVCETEGASWLPFHFIAEAKTNEAAGGGKRCREFLWTNDL